jgi:hypothetical protein
VQQVSESGEAFFHAKFFLELAVKYGIVLIHSKIWQVCQHQTGEIDMPGWAFDAVHLIHGET